MLFELVFLAISIEDFVASSRPRLTIISPLYEEFNIKGEPSGCVSLAAILSNKINVKGKNVLVTISGGNVDDDSFDKYIASA